jgi:hypothetical protein
LDASDKEIASPGKPSWVGLNANVAGIVLEIDLEARGLRPKNIAVLRARTLVETSRFNAGKAGNLVKFAFQFPLASGKI